MSSVFLVVESSKIIFHIYKMLYPKRKIESYSILGTIVLLFFTAVRQSLEASGLLPAQKWNSAMYALGKS